MTTYNGRCHCGQTQWTTKLDGDASILWSGNKTALKPKIMS